MLTYYNPHYYSYSHHTASLDLFIPIGKQLNSQKSSYLSRAFMFLRTSVLLLHCTPSLTLKLDDFAVFLWPQENVGATIPDPDMAYSYPETLLLSGHRGRERRGYARHCSPCFPFRKNPWRFPKQTIVLPRISEENGCRSDQDILEESRFVPNSPVAVRLLGPKEERKANYSCQTTVAPWFENHGRL